MKIAFLKTEFHYYHFTNYLFSNLCGSYSNCVRLFCIKYTTTSTTTSLFHHLLAPSLSVISLIIKNHLLPNDDNDCAFFLAVLKPRSHRLLTVCYIGLQYIKPIKPLNRITLTFLSFLSRLRLMGTMVFASSKFVHAVQIFANSGKGWPFAQLIISFSWKPRTLA